MSQRELISIEEAPNIDTMLRSVATVQNCGTGYEFKKGSHESRLNLGDHDGSIRVRRHAGERCLPECVIGRHIGLTPRVIVCSAISYHGRSNLLRNEGNLNSNRKTVWCALWAGGIIGPYFKNDEGHNVTFNGDRYRAMITNFFIPELNDHDVQELWFQQDGATCHIARATIDLLKDIFGDRLISHLGPVNWPPRSCDLTPLDYLLWGYVKSLVYADKPLTLDHLEDNICRVIADIRPQMLENVIENWTSRLDYIRASRGSPMPEIIFKM
ncbi:transposable element Tc3 transposase [Trichonephila clavipes]|nr:transposable element Tc3 transposase [Trichonephila clavipes]